jgi:hypothetical protein
MKLKLAAAAALVAAISLSAAAQAREIRVEGCVTLYKACIVVWNKGHPYNVTWAFPRPVPGTYVRAKGTVAGPAVICKGATNLIPVFALHLPGYCSKGVRKGY